MLVEPDQYIYIPYIGIYNHIFFFYVLPHGRSLVTNSACKTMDQARQIKQPLRPIQAAANDSAAEGSRGEATSGDAANGSAGNKDGAGLREDGLNGSMDD